MVRKKQRNTGVPKSVLMPAPLYRAIVQKADNEDRPISSIVRFAIRKELGMLAQKDQPKQNSNNHEFHP